MEIHGLWSTNTTAETAATKDGAADEIGRDVFMKLFVAQLQNQDPLDPTDSREFITQLSQLTSVDQLVQIGSKVRALEVATIAQSNAQAANLVGKRVVATGDNLHLGESGGASAGFRLPSRASEVSIAIHSSSGELIKNIEAVNLMPGIHSLHWDGSDSSGRPVPPGRYRLQVLARDSDGNPMEVSTEIIGRVSAVAYDNGYPELMVGNSRVLLGDVTSIGE